MLEAQQPLLSVRDLKTYFFTAEGTVRAIDGATFDVRPGQTVGIVGESGCGKSVTGRSILRIVERPGRILAGQILWRRNGHVGEQAYLDLVKLDPKGKQMRAIRGGEIGLVFQEPMTSFSPVHTIGNQIVENLRLHQRLSKPEARDRAVELLRSVGIPRADQRLEAYSFQLSGGLRQRAMIAMALACDPLLLIADEQVVERGPVDAIFHSPKHPYTQALLRSIPSIRAEPRTHLPTISGSVPHPFDRPVGCPYHPRCQAFIAGTCDADEPMLVAVGERQQASCFLYEGA